MTEASPRHQWISGSSREARAEVLTELSLPPLLLAVDAHRRLRGPYTAAGSVVRALVPDVRARFPELIAAHDTEVLAVAPELRGRVTSTRETLTSLAATEERTRFYPPARTTRLAHGLVELVRDAVSATGAGGRTLVLEHADEADATDLEWIALLLRRIDPQLLRVVVCTSEGPVPAALGDALGEHAVRRPARQAAAGGRADGVAGEPEQQLRLAQRHVRGDCLGDDPRLLAAYRALPVASRAELHDARADELEARGEDTLRVGAIPFHREHGSDPAGAGADALLDAMQRCMLMGFYEATRFFSAERRDHVEAKAHINTAIALSAGFDDVRQRAFNMTFNENGLALIEMHLGDGTRALELVTAGLQPRRPGCRDRGCRTSAGRLRLRARARSDFQRCPPQPGEPAARPGRDRGGQPRGR